MTTYQEKIHLGQIYNFQKCIYNAGKYRAYFNYFHQFSKNTKYYSKILNACSIYLKIPYQPDKQTKHDDNLQRAS